MEKLPGWQPPQAGGLSWKILGCVRSVSQSASPNYGATGEEGMKPPRPSHLLPPP